MAKLHGAVRFVSAVGLCAFLGLYPWPVAFGAEEPVTISKSEEYFPDTVGSRWTYRGQISEGPLQTVELKLFTNVSTVTGTKAINGVTVTVFHDTNPGNHGASDSFYRRDAVGIVYYGSEPGTPLEKHITPYQIFRFPLRVPSSFQQFDRIGVDFGNDMDRDQTDETVDTQGWSKVIGRETITVPAGTFQEAVKVEARMNMKIHLSGSRRTVTGIDVMTAWFAKGVGLVKYSERQELAAVKEDRGVVTEITEELEEYDIKAAKASLSRLESPAKGVLADDPGDHELGQIVFPARFRTNP
ncbi:TapB family protein [Candidatus Nitrospira nitrificans]|uniref:DUF3108 domain-containing protein n=1 Tax=Candidatus Nitrospira nitrificans TaxID=1742973 RepID=A0A0S4LKH9_9BACT|nr:hypothetical protein [Candidatus Nitrospira nitrificans]CUS38044.1 conserved exported hypothetical protein [Candidatus Nitrospira nitrificans]